MENKQGYDPSEFEDDDYTTPQPDAGKSIRGYRIVIIILSVILAALSVLYFIIVRSVPTSFSYCLIFARFHERSFLRRVISESARSRSRVSPAEIESFEMRSPS